MYDLIPLKVTQGIHSASSRTPHKVAIRHGAHSISYIELINNMRRVSYAAFTDIRFQGNASIVGVNSIEFVEVLLGLADVGIPVVTISPKSSSREIIAALISSNTRVLFIDEKLYRDEYKSYVDLVITFGSKYKNWLDNQQPLTKYPFIDDKTIFNIVYTSGTTGEPKGICISHRSRHQSFLTMALNFNSMQIDDVMLCISSLSNGGGNASALGTLNSGGTIVLATQVHPDYIMRMIEQHRITTMIVVPTVTSLIVNTPSCHKYDRSSLRSVISIAAPFVPELKLKALEFFGDIVYDVLATTECGPITVQTPMQMKTHLSSVGQTVYGSTVKIIKGDGEVAKPYEVGEILSQTLSMFSGYLNKGGPDQFVSAGDLGYVDEENYVYVVGRKNDMIITCGNNVYPEEVESVINSCPGVVESAVVGVPDDRWGEIVTAFIVGEPTEDPIKYCKDSLASYKIPRKILYVHSIPRNDAGKILRKNLRNSYK